MCHISPPNRSLPLYGEGGGWLDDRGGCPPGHGGLVIRARYPSPIILTHKPVSLQPHQINTKWIFQKNSPFDSKMKLNSLKSKLVSLTSKEILVPHCIACFIPSETMFFIWSGPPAEERDSQNFRCFFLSCQLFSLVHRLLNFSLSSPTSIYCGSCRASTFKNIPPLSTPQDKSEARGHTPLGSASDRAVVLVHRSTTLAKNLFFGIVFARPDLFFTF